MNQRESTRSVAIGRIALGGQNRVLVQSMCNIKTSQAEAVAAQINRCAALGADLMRVSVLDFEDAKAIGTIKKRVSIPLVADIHIDYRLALAAIESGVDAIRINPGNIGSKDKIKLVVDACKSRRLPIRVGVNSGSLDKTVYDGKGLIKAKYLVESCAKHVRILESMGFRDIVLSLKGSDVIETIEAYRLAAKAFPYPLHLGITEAGPKDIGLIRSAAGLSPLLLEGIGDTIRISLSDSPEEEVRAASRLLHDLGLKKDYPTFISCPTCGRTQVDLIPLANRVREYLEDHHVNKTVAVMGCVVNGPGEARHADLGAAGGKGQWVIFKKGEPLKTVADGEVYETLIEEIKKL
ncbi:MAG: flavodoxin-dependent (E)-4-hydroxy-3-methylbut-2-enyl-diphosphate synthase [Bacilli bacterium]|jgi:(E)-4-hydroxy-3-methylbut-2-enyl-diphosphate synthase|nr:flavodoxin-dependent (E)-4-hydroxy-3-methylbut-2-enyl-diphosphate synthase [Bacilli bacterium]MCI2111299.1 flavodoxin-dependent (E)-4-hydroxy-3-methylbut-2-enyl-diphosphate synthase [Bacilli bacterium]